MPISKIELKKKLRSLGIKVEGNYVRKSDIEKVVLAENENEKEWLDDNKGVRNKKYLETQKKEKEIVENLIQEVTEDIASKWAMSGGDKLSTDEKKELHKAIDEFFQKKSDSRWEKDFGVYDNKSDRPRSFKSKFSGRAEAEEKEEAGDSDKTYKIVRFYQKNHPKEIIKTGLSFEEAQEHCNDDETSSSTCEKPENVARTEKMGEWFDGYNEE